MVDCHNDRFILHGPKQFGATLFVIVVPSTY